jgi:hypothetical protein
VLDSEHIVAFALGVAVFTWFPRRRDDAPLDSLSADDVDRELEELLEARA